MNVVWNDQERFGFIFSRLKADQFNLFIDSTGLADLPIRGRSYTWMNKADTKLSKLDHFLISKDALEALLAFVLVNGSPTSEFSIKREFRKGDPLLPFLVILVMKGLYGVLSNVVDGVIITSDWNARDLDNIIRVLHVYNLASGFRINIHKSNIYGIGVSVDDVLSMSRNSGCALTLIDHFYLRLSSLKANLLSIGGQLTLIKAVLGSLGLNPPPPPDSPSHNFLFTNAIPDGLPP
ncbi:putative RNA-directed DNA polymerase, eukaryota, reverse transcriptase zinc-binding domain protein [Tanacetum coccineum]